MCQISFFVVIFIFIIAEYRQLFKYIMKVDKKKLIYSTVQGGIMFKKYAAITAACAVYAFGYACFLSPNRLAPGGVSGLAVILGRFLPIDSGIIILCLNIPLLAAGFFVFGKVFLFPTLYATVVSSLFISAASFLPAGLLPVTGDLLIAGAAGGVLLGAGIGWIFRLGATTGGTDIVVRLLTRKLPHIRSGFFFLAVDSLVVILSAIVFGHADLALYAALSLFVSTKVFDAVLYGTNTARLLLIITAKPAEVIAEATKKLDLGITVLEAKGGYTGTSNTLLVCAVKKPAYPAMRQLVQRQDPAAFMIVASADEVYGTGFLSKENP